MRITNNYLNTKFNLVYYTSFTLSIVRNYKRFEYEFLKTLGWLRLWYFSSSIQTILNRRI